MSEERVIWHLLIPKEFRVWCMPRRAIKAVKFTRFPSEATCANCLTCFRFHKSGNKRRFKVAHTQREGKHD